MKSRYYTKTFLRFFALSIFLPALLSNAQTFNGAFSYNTKDALLVLSSDTYDSIYFDLGPISQFLNKPSGYQVQVTNWDPNVVTTYLGPFPSGGGYLTINFNIGAGDPITTYDAWATYTVKKTLTSAGAYEVGFTIDANGQNLLALSQNQIAQSQAPKVGDVFNTNSVVLVPTHNIAWDYKSGDNGWSDGYLTGGKFYASIPGSISFWQFSANSTTNVGTFQFTADGRLFFTVGSVLDKTTITDVEYDGVTEADITFNTKIGANYRLLESTNLALPLGSWPIVNSAIVDYPNGGTSTGSVSGDGDPHTLSDLNATNNATFYSIESF